MVGMTFQCGLVGEDTGDPISKLDYFAAANGQHENGKGNGTKPPRVGE